MQPEAQHEALRERLSRLIFRLDGSLTANPSGLSQSDRINLTLKREEVSELRGALARANDEIRRLKASMAYPSPVQLAEEAVRTRRRKVRDLTSECGQWRRLVTPFELETAAEKSTEQEQVWSRRLEELRRENLALKKRQRQVEDVVRDKHAVVTEKERKFRETEAAEIDKLERQIRVLKGNFVAL